MQQILDLTSPTLVFIKKQKKNKKEIMIWLSTQIKEKIYIASHL